MPEPWMVDECRRQALLYLAHASRVEVDGDTVTMPEPLLRHEAATLARLRDEADSLRESGADCPAIMQRV